MERYIVFVISLLGLFGCSEPLKKNVEQLMGQQIVFPESLHAMHQGVDTVINDFFAGADYKMVVWYDSVGCTSCAVNKLFLWNDIIEYAAQSNFKFRPVFIFSPKQENQFSLSLALRTYEFDYPVFLDKGLRFLQENSYIPSDNRLHTFLVDRDNRIVLVGSPLQNDALWTLYKKTMEQEN